MGSHSRSRSPVPDHRSRDLSPPTRNYSPPPRRGDDDRTLDASATNPGNNLYVTGLSVRVSEDDLKAHFEQAGKVSECRLVVDPRTKESRGFGFVQMDNVDDAERALRRLNNSVLQNRVISVEKAKRKRERTPTPGAYLGRRGVRELDARKGAGGGRFDDRDRYGRDSRDDRRDRYDDRRDRDYDRRPRGSPRYSPGPGRRERSPRYSPYRR